jgi:hypothetical protein
MDEKLNFDIIQVCGIRLSKYSTYAPKSTWQKQNSEHFGHVKKFRAENTERYTATAPLTLKSISALRRQTSVAKTKDPFAGNPAIWQLSRRGWAQLEAHLPETGS